MMLAVLGLLAAASLVVPGAHAPRPTVAPNWPWFNSSLPMETRLNLLVEAMVSNNPRPALCGAHS